MLLIELVGLNFSKYLDCLVGTFIMFLTWEMGHH